MTATGFLVGVLAGIGVLALAVIFAAIFVIKRMQTLTRDGFPYAPSKIKGFSEFKKRVDTILEDAPVNSNICATLPIPAVDVIMRVAGRKANINSYRLEIRLGYKRLDHLEMVQTQLNKYPLKFERTDKGNGAIKLLSEKVETTTELLKICGEIRSLVTYDLEDGKIKVFENIRSGAKDKTPT